MTADARGGVRVEFDGGDKNRWCTECIQDDLDYAKQWAGHHSASERRDEGWRIGSYRDS